MLAPWKKSYDQPTQQPENRDISLSTKVCLVKAMVFPVVMYGCEKWDIKKAEHQRIDAFELWFWIRLLRVPWTARRSKQSILRKSVLNIHWKDWCLSWNSNTLVTWCEELTHLKRLWCWEWLKAVRRRGQQRMRWLDGITDSMDMSLSSSVSWWWTGKPGMLQSMGSQRVTYDWATELNWTELNWINVWISCTSWNSSTVGKTLPPFTS